MYPPEAGGHFEALDAAAEGGAVLHEALRVREAGGAVARVLAVWPDVGLGADAVPVGAAHGVAHTLLVAA